MTIVYRAALICAAIFLSGTVGRHIGKLQCELRAASAGSEQMITHMELVGVTNEKVMHTGVGDIRNILHEKYTIAE